MLVENAPEPQWNGRAGRLYLSTLEAFLAKHMARGRRFQEAMGRGSGDAEQPLPVVFGGDCSPTVARLELGHSVFLCEAHQRLTGNLSFQVNLLHTLLSERDD